MLTKTGNDFSMPFDSLIGRSNNMERERRKYIIRLCFIPHASLSSDYLTTCSKNQVYNEKIRAEFIKTDDYGKLKFRRALYDTIGIMNSFLLY